MDPLLGKQAPSFILPADTGESISLSSFLGKKVILYFYPKDLTPGCTQQACDFRDHFSEFSKQNVVVLGISRDSLSLHQKFKKTYQLPFPLLSDEDGKVCEAYGVWKEKSMYGKKYMGIDRSTFVIDEKGLIQFVQRGVKVPQHVEDLLSSLKK